MNGTERNEMKKENIRMKEKGKKTHTLFPLPFDDAPEYSLFFLSLVQCSI